VQVLLVLVQPEQVLVPQVLQGRLEQGQVLLVQR
jgi:hypothetical protein